MSHERPGKSDEWYTPKYIFDALGVQFTMDVAAPEDRAFCAVPAEEFLTRKSLEAPWRGFVWMNPPFGGRNGIVPWTDKFFAHGHGIMLCPDRTGAPWWQSAAKRASGLLFVSPKVKFLNAQGVPGRSPSVGTVLMGAGIVAPVPLKSAAKKLGVYLEAAR